MEACAWRPSRSALHLNELKVVLVPRAWEHAEEELRIRRENAVEADYDVDGDDRRSDDDGASTSTSSSSLTPSLAAYCVLWCWSRAENNWRWIYTSEAVQPRSLHRRRGRRRTGKKKDGSNNSNDSLLSWSPLDLSYALRSSREALEAAASSGVIHLHVHLSAATGGKSNVTPCSYSASPPSCCPCHGGRQRLIGDPLLLSATLRLEDAAAVVSEDEESKPSSPSVAVVASLGPERVAWVPSCSGGKGKGNGKGWDEAKTAAATSLPPFLPLPSPLPPPPSPLLLLAASGAAEARAKAVAATRALELALEEKRRSKEGASELARAAAAAALAAAGDDDARATLLEQRATTIREATNRSKAETSRRASALSEARRGLELCLERVEELRASVSGGGASGAASPSPPSARAVLGRALSSLVARRCALVAGIGEAMELLPKAAAVSGKQGQRQRRQASSAAGGGGEGEGEEEDGNGVGDSTWDRLESGWSSGLGGIRQQEQQQRAGNNGNGALSSPPKQTNSICGLRLDPSVAGRGWQQRPNLPSKPQLDADAAALASAAEAAGAIASVLALPLRHPLRPLPTARGARCGAAAVAFAPPPLARGGRKQQPGRGEFSSSSHHPSSSSAAAPVVVVDAVGAAMLFQGAAVAPSATEGASANGGAKDGENGGGGRSDGSSAAAATAAAPAASLLHSSLLSSAAEFSLFLPGSTVGGLNGGGIIGEGGIGIGGGGLGGASIPSSSASASDDAAALLASTEPATRFAYAVFLLDRCVQQLLDAHGLAGSGPGRSVEGLAKLVAAAASVASLR